MKLAYDPAMDAASPPFTRNALALVSLVGSTLAALSLVPTSAWRQPQEPSVRAAALMVVVLLAVLVLRSLGAQGALRERQLLCVFLAAMPLVYMESGLWNDAGSWLLVEGTGLIVFSGWAWLACSAMQSGLPRALRPRSAVGLVAQRVFLHSAWMATPAGRHLGLRYSCCCSVSAGRRLGERVCTGSCRSAGAMPVLDARAAAIRADMFQDLTKTLRTLDRLYGSLQQGVDSDATDRRASYVAACQDIRIVLTRLLLLLPSLKAGGMVMPTWRRNGNRRAPSASSRRMS